MHTPSYWGCGSTNNSNSCESGASTCLPPFRVPWLTPRKRSDVFFFAFPDIFVFTPTSMNHSQRRAPTAFEGSHCSKAMWTGNSEDSHHWVKKIWHSSDITIDEKTRGKQVGRGFEGTTISGIFRVSVQRGRMWKLFYDPRKPRKIFWAIITKGMFGANLTLFLTKRTPHLKWSIGVAAFL